MLTGLLVLFIISSGIIYFRTNRTILFWIACYAIWLDAACLAAFRELRSAAIWWWRSLPAAVKEVQRDVLARS